MPKISVWRHVNIGTIDNGQNICPISIIKVGQQFCEMSLYENTEELFGDFEENDYLCSDIWHIETKQNDADRKFLNRYLLKFCLSVSDW